ncbi:MAG: hypothetical protein U0Q16_03590 [Bryobacteraceae bacterium]
MSEYRPIWWLHPAVPLAIPAGASALFAWMLPASSFETHWKTWKFFDTPHLALVALSILTFLIGLAASRRFVAGDSGPAASAAFDRAAAQTLIGIGAWLTLAGYAIWLAAAISRGMTLNDVLGVFRGDKMAAYDMKEIYLVTVSGLSTLTQFGVAAVVLASVSATSIGWRRVALPVAAIAGFAAVRSVLNSERLAMVELVVPGAIGLFLTLPPKWLTGRRITFLRIAPAVAPVLLLAFFTGSEYFRSWKNYYAAQGGSLVEFGATRLSGYYLTSINNSAYLIDRIGKPLGIPYFTASFLYRFPGLSDLAKEAFLPIPAFAGSELTPDEMLANGANPEFNNPGGLLAPYMDFGLWLGAFYWLGAGVLSGILFRLALARHPVGLCLYPVLYLSLLEAPRILYWSEGKFIPPLAMLLGAAWWLSRRQAGRLARMAWESHREARA